MPITTSNQGYILYILCMDHDCKLTIQWQQTQLEDYCSHYGQTGSVHWNHMLYEDKSKVIYCYVPKTGCTQMKTMIVLLQGLHKYSC